MTIIRVFFRPTINRTSFRSEFHQQAKCIAPGIRIVVSSSNHPQSRVICSRVKRKSNYPQDRSGGGIAAAAVRLIAVIAA
jgi:hypothetical protein